MNEINTELFKNFNRYQEVNKCWRKVDGEWVIKDIVFIEQWRKKEFEFLVDCLLNTVKTGGKVFGAFNNYSLVGFSSVENELFGSNSEYLQLSSIHISHEYRGIGIGKKLFELSCKGAKDLGASKLYISAHSSVETQSFYKNVGCIEAKEYNVKLVEDEPYDCQLELKL